ncbi:phosphate acetyltransferase [Thalassovita litoralis]|jgi:phosphate acetyltransferase|uniref:Phosphate acetyltransferase n=1 Tax=Thalassovita litoralis TaxID=1010611 RepID=A0A521DT60_9RHOB|nr:phosphate acyltransferase [Thalassovita litoralis]SMO74805.1 phosphate acetyltransferase [Thalassovita litoralis]
MQLSVRDPFPFVSATTAEAPQRLLAQARGLPTPRVALVNAASVNALTGIREAADAGMADPILIGDAEKIRQIADDIEWDISTLPLIHAPHTEAAPKAAELARTGQADAIMKGQIHTSTFLKGLLPRSAGLRDDSTRCGHVFHITMPESDRPILLTDGALNVDPDVDTRKECLRHAVRLARQLGISHPKAGILSATEDPIPSLPNSMQAREIADWAKTALPHCSVSGPMAMDLILSRDAAEAKGYESDVCGDADIILTPNITTGNAVFKLMVLGMGCCAAGLVLGAKVPILLTSRAQAAPARIASAALGVIAAGADA